MLSRSRSPAPRWLHHYPGDYLEFRQSCFVDGVPGMSWRNHKLIKSMSSILKGRSRRFGSERASSQVTLSRTRNERIRSDQTHARERSCRNTGNQELQNLGDRRSFGSRQLPIACEEKSIRNTMASSLQDAGDDVAGWLWEVAATVMKAEIEA